MYQFLIYLAVGSFCGSLVGIMTAFFAVEIMIQRFESSPSPLRPEDGCTGRRASPRA